MLAGELRDPQAYNCRFWAILEAEIGEEEEWTEKRCLRR